MCCARMLLQAAGGPQQMGAPKGPPRGSLKGPPLEPNLANAFIIEKLYLVKGIH